MLPNKLPEYTITSVNEPPFEVRWEEILGWFFVPKLGEKLSWAIYDQPGGERKEMYDTESIGRAVIHGIEGIEVIARETKPDETLNIDGTPCTDRTFVAQLTDTHSRILAESHVADGVRYFYTFLDGDDFLPNWGYGEDNCGKSIFPLRKSAPVEIDSGADSVSVHEVVLKSRNYDMRCMVQVKGGGKLPETHIVTGRFTVQIAGKHYDTICVVDVENYDGGVLSETYIDANGRTVLWRRFNRDDWHIERYGKPWSEQLANNERVTANGTTYVHWYDCITDYILR